MKTFVTVLCLLFGVVCNAQLKPPTQVDTLVVVDLEYNYSSLSMNNWPFKYVYRSGTSFKFGDVGEFEIVGVNRLTSCVEFILKDRNGSDREEYRLLQEDEDYGKIKISFSGYICHCVLKDSLRESQENSETEEDEDDADEDFVLIEVKPTFKGGDANTFSKWVEENLRYPRDAKREGISGRVMLSFTVASDGYVKSVKVLRGLYPSLDAEAVRVVSSSPRWSPGMAGGKPVDVTYTFPVIFQFR